MGDGACNRAATACDRTVAVVGAGIAGLAAASTLARQGLGVRVFERGRGPGGRAAHRRAGAHTFDHGAQYFTARDAHFARHCGDWAEAGVIAPWRGRIVALNRGGAAAPTSPLARYVGVPGMNAIAKHLAQGLDVTAHCTVTGLARKGGAWRVHTADGTATGSFDAVVLAMPPEQAARVVPLDTLHGGPVDARSQPCWCAMAAFDAPLALDFDGAFVNGAAVDWVARDSSKPGRPDGERWVVHAGAAWSAQRLEQPRDAVAQELLGHFFDALGLTPRVPVYLAGHRWSLARPARELDVGCLWSPGEALAVCGDWCLGGRLEGAFLSGVAAAGRIAGPAAHQGMR